MKQIIYPKKIVLSSGFDCKNLLVKQPLQIGLSEKKGTFIPKNGFVVLDFAKEMHGGIRILTFATNGATARVRLGESVSECCAELGGERNATNDHSNRDFTVQLQAYSDMTFANSGFRFARIDFSEDTIVKSIVAVNYILSKPTVYEYSGKDLLIDRIFKTAKRTVDLCASSGYIWDGIKRDRLVWIGDMHPEMLALTTLYGRMEEIEKSLDFVKEQTPLPEWMNGYPMYSMWWIIIVADYYKKTKTAFFAQNQIEYMQGLVKQMLDCVDENGKLNYPSYFVDWPTSGKADEIHGVRAINILAAKKAIEFFTEFNIDCYTAKELLNRLIKVEITPTTQKQVAGLKYFATGLNETDKSMLIDGGAKGMSTFMSYYILKAVASFDKSAAISMLKQYYGGMLERGATTFWEDFDIEWLDGSGRIDCLPKDGEKDIHGDYGAYCYKGFRHSLCHGWSAGIIQFIQEECE